MKILNLYVSSFGTNKRQRIWKTVKTVNSRLKTKGHKHFLDLWLKSIPVYKDKLLPKQYQNFETHIKEL